MHLPLEINFGQLPASPSIRSAVRAGTATLNRYYPEIIGCHVDLSPGDSGTVPQVHIKLKLPGAEVDVNQAQESHEDLESAVQRAFATMQLRLADWVAGQR